MIVEERVIVEENFFKEFIENLKEYKKRLGAYQFKFNHGSSNSYNITTSQEEEKAST